MTRWLAAIAVLLTLGFGPAASDEPSPVLVELFTSQGCSSCPPADALLQELAGRDDVVALALHVDYWDYLGWTDTMGSPAHTRRQKQYAHAAGSRTIYTPQMIIGGVTHVVGHRPMALAKALETARARDAGVDLDLRLRGGLLWISAAPAPGLPREMVIVMARYVPSYDVAIKRGENRGRTISYVNAVLQMSQIGTWSGRSALDLRVDPGHVEHATGIAVFIQEPGPGRVLAAARLE